MLTHPNIDPVIISIGPLQVRWYGLMYIISFLCALFITKRYLKEIGLSEKTPFLENLLFYSFLGLIIGARVGFCFFYYPDYFLAHPLEIVKVWKGGMSFHGGLIGALAFGFAYIKKHKESFLFWADVASIPAPLGLFFGRIGNFINGEIFGKPTNLPWGMVFPEGGPIPRHPVQLYESLVTGLFLFLIMYSLRHKAWPDGAKFALFLVLYGILRFLFEFLREPAQSLPLLFGWMTMGQVLCIFMISLGLTLLYLVFSRQKFI
jgi:phosphatidylglycerol:prolipoprotein diacylglycerol transferase